MTASATNNHVVRDFIHTVWAGQNLGALRDFWTEDCLNHAMPGPDNRGLAALHVYHAAFAADFAAFAGVEIDVVQQVAEGDRVVTQLVARGEHRGSFLGIQPTGKQVALGTIRIDRLRDGRIAEHWSVADIAGLMQQLHA